MGLITGQETASEMLSIAYAMEEGMRTLHETLAERVADEEAASLFRKLSEVETEHKQMLFELYKSHGGKEATVEALEEQISANVTEAGISTEELVEAHRADIKTVEDVVMFAMMLETQALDLYLRYAHRSEDDETKSVLYELAGEEKKHLRWLGELLEKS